MKLYSSTFISIVMAFLMLMGLNNQPIEVAEDPKLPVFSNIHEINIENPSDSLRVDVFDNLFCEECTYFTSNSLPKIRDLVKETENIDLRLYVILDINEEINYMTVMSLKCAADQDKFWDMYRKIHENKADLNKKSFIQFGKELEINTDALQECMDEEAHKKEIEEDIKYATDKEITFYPTTIIGKYLLIGDQPYENVQKIINRSLKKIEKAPLKTIADPETEVLEVKDLTDNPDIKIGDEVINSKPTDTTTTLEIDLGI